ISPFNAIQHLILNNYKKFYVLLFTICVLYVILYLQADSFNYLEIVLHMIEEYVGTTFLFHAMLNQYSLGGFMVVKKKSWFTLVSLILILSTVLAGCGGKGNGEAGAGNGNGNAGKSSET